MKMNLNPSLGEKLIRSRARIDRLDIAIAKSTNKERTQSLQQERDTRANEIKQFAEGI